MRKKSRRTDIVIVIVLIAIVVFTVLSANKRDSASDGQAVPITMEQYDGKTLGAMPGSLSEDIAVERFPNSPIQYYTGTPDLCTALLTGKIDGFVSSRIILEQLAKENNNITWFPEVLRTGYRYMGFPKTAKGEKLRAQLDEMLLAYQADGTMEQIEGIWYGDDESLKVVDDSGLTGENGTLQVGICATDEPYNYYSGQKLTGFNVDLVNRFARRYGYALEYTDTNAPSLLIGLTTGKFDMLAFAFSYSEERAQTMLFSEPVIRFENHLAVRASDNPEGARGVAVEQAGLLERIAGSFEKTFIREERWKLILEGIWNTTVITALAVLLGTVLGLAICLFRRTGSALANIISDLYVKIMQGMPMVVLLLILYYVIFGDSSLAAMWVAVVGFSLHFGAYNSETLRSGIASVPPGQREAALALGYTENEAFYHFILPQAVNHIMPVYVGEVISLLKGTAVAGYISVQDLTKVSDIIRSRTYEAFFPLIATALIYFLLAWIIRQLLNMVMKRINPRFEGGKKK